MAERVILGSPDGELDITDWIRSPDGGNYGEAAAEVFLAQDGSVGERVIDTRWTNRTANLPLNLKERGGTAFSTIRSSIQAFAAQASVPGGGGCYVTRVLANGGTVQGDIQAAGVTLSGGFQQAHRDSDNEAELRLQTLPDWYTPTEINAGTISATATGQAIGTFTDIEGDFPEGNRCRLVITAGTAADVLGVKYAIRSKHYSADATARLSYEAEALDPLDLAAGTALAGASGGTAVYHPNLGTGWTPVLGTNMGGTAYLTHTGTYRLEARVYTTSATPPELRCVYDVGDLVNPAENDKDIKQIPGASNFYLLDLGELRLDRSPVGDHRWLGQIQARGAAGGENVYIDRVRLWPVDEYYAEITASIAPEMSAFGSHIGRDEFGQVVSGGSDPLAGLTAPAGGPWAGAGDSDDFVVEDTGHTAQRTATTDASGIQNARFALLGASSTDTVVGLEHKFTFGPAAGLVSRYTNTSNFFAIVLDPGIGQAHVHRRISGTTTTQTLSGLTLGAMTADTFYELRMHVTAEGHWFFWVRLIGGRYELIGMGRYSELSASGALASGRSGFCDHWVPVQACTRTYANYAAWAPERDAVIFAGEAAELRTDGASRASADGVGSGVLVPFGNPPRLPQGGPVEVMAAVSRGGFDQLPDFELIDASVEVHDHVTWLTAPSA